MDSAPYAPLLLAARCRQINGGAPLPVVFILNSGAHFCRTTRGAAWAACSGDFMFAERSVANIGPGSQVGTVTTAKCRLDQGNGQYPQSLPVNVAPIRVALLMLTCWSTRCHSGALHGVLRCARFPKF